MVVASSSMHASICGSMSRGFCILLHHHTPQSTTVLECFLCTLMACVRCCLIDADKYWAEACAHETYLVNVTPTEVNPDYASLYELWHAHSHLYICCMCFAALALWLHQASTRRSFSLERLMYASSVTIQRPLLFFASLSTPLAT